MAASEGLSALNVDETQSRSWLDHMHDWVTTVDHKKLGILYIGSGLLFFVLGGLEASLMRAQLAVPANDLIDPKEFKEVYSPMAEPTLAPYGGSFMIKHAIAPPMAEKMGMKVTKSTGTTGQMAFVLQFDDFDKATGWFTGPEYAGVIEKRDQVADFNMAVVGAMK